MPLPEIPSSWFQLIQLLVTSALLILGVLGYQKVERVQEQQAVTHQKQDAAAEKIDVVEQKQDVQKLTTGRIAEKVGAKVNGN